MLDIFYQIFNMAISTLITEVKMKSDLKKGIVFAIAFWTYVGLWLYVGYPLLDKYFGV